MALPCTLLLGRPLQVRMSMPVALVALYSSVLLGHSSLGGWVNTNHSVATGKEYYHLPA